MSYANTALLLPGNGADTGTSFPDYSRHNLLAVRGGNTLPTTTTAQSKFYGSSGFFPSNGSGQPSQLRYSVFSPAISTGPMTVQCWVRVPASNPQCTIVDTRASAGFSALTNQNAAFSFSVNGSGVLQFLYGSGGSTLVGTTVLSNLVWHHIAMTRDGSDVVRLFLDGVEEASATISLDWTATRTTTGGVAGSVNFADRWMQDFQLIAGTALYTGAFTPPAKLIAPVAGTITDDVGAAVERRVWVIPRIAGPVHAFGGLSSAVDGTYSIDAPDIECTRVVLDDDAGTQYNDLIDRVAVSV